MQNAAFGCVPENDALDQSPLLQCGGVPGANLSGHCSISLSQVLSLRASLLTQASKLSGRAEGAQISQFHRDETSSELSASTVSIRFTKTVPARSPGNLIIVHKMRGNYAEYIQIIMVEGQ